MASYVYVVEQEYETLTVKYIPIRQRRQQTKNYTVYAKYQDIFFNWFIFKLLFS